MTHPPLHEPISIGRPAAKPQLRVLQGVQTSEPSADAQKAAAKLGRRGIRPSADLAEVRRRYTESRRLLLAPLEPVESIFPVRPLTGQVPPLTIIRPKTFSENRSSGALVYLHGGGWTVGEFETYEPLCRQLANALDSVVIFVDYRLAPEHPFPAAFNDTRNALHWVFENAKLLGVDARRIAIGGDSAGGNLAASVCLAERMDWSRTQPSLQLLIYPCLDLMACMDSHRTFSGGPLLTNELYSWYRQNYMNGYVKPGHWRLSPLFAHDLGGLPPAIVLYAGFDPLRDEAAAYARRLESASVPVETLFFPDMIHGFMTMGGVVGAADVGIRRIAEAFHGLAAKESKAGPR